MKRRENVSQNADQSNKKMCENFRDAVSSFLCIFFIRHLALTRQFMARRKFILCTGGDGEAAGRKSGREKGEEEERVGVGE